MEGKEQQVLCVRAGVELWGAAWEPRWRGGLDPARLGAVWNPVSVSEKDYVSTEGCCPCKNTGPSLAQEGNVSADGNPGVTLLPLSPIFTPTEPYHSHPTVACHYQEANQGEGGGKAQPSTLVTPRE